MAGRIKFRGGTSEQHSTFTGATREITIDTSKNTVVVHDGSTVGGFALARDSVVTSILETKVDKNTGIVAGTGTKVTYDEKGLVTGSTGLSDTDIPDLDISKITSGILDVVRGGTGVTSSTGSGSVVLSKSPTFTGTPTAPTQVINNNSTSIATTAYADRAALPINSLRADRYLSLQDIANMVYTSGDLTKIQYNNATDVDYEVLGYTGGNLITIQHYVGSVLKGTTTLSYTSDNLVSAVFV